MADMTVAIPERGQPRPDGLCTVCWKPSLRRFEMWRVSLIGLAGMTLVGYRVACTDCKRWAGPAQKLEETRK